MGLFAIGAIFFLRGLALVKEIPQFVNHAVSLPTRELYFSSVSLVIGIMYLIGLVLRWRDLI